VEDALTAPANSHFGLWVIGGNSHWSLVVALVHAGKPFFGWHLDSLQNLACHSVDKVNSLLVTEHSAVGLQLVAAKGVPQQSNHNDCGWFTVARLLDIITRPQVLWQLALEGHSGDVSAVVAAVLTNVPSMPQAAEGSAVQAAVWTATVQEAKACLRSHYGRVSCWLAATGACL
jgi:hypothetical protein